LPAAKYAGSSKESSAFLKKSAQKTFAPGGVWTGIAFNRLRWSRLAAIPVPTTPGAKGFLVASGGAPFFQKK
jgi:hypothetical protein